MDDISVITSPYIKKKKKKKKKKNLLEFVVLFPVKPECTIEAADKPREERKKERTSTTLIYEH